MKHAALVVLLAAFAASEAAAQWLGTPAWNTPKMGTGLTIYGDYGAPNTDAGKGHTFGGRATLGVGTLALTAGVESWKPDGFNDRVTSYGGTAAFRLIGGSLIPVAVNLQVGLAHSPQVTSGGPDTVLATTTVLGAVGLSVPLPTPGFSIEPYFSPGIRYHHYSSGASYATGTNETNFGWVVGGNLGFGLVGIHLAYDSEKFANGTHGVFGIGANVGLRLPMGM